VSRGRERQREPTSVGTSTFIFVFFLFLSCGNKPPHLVACLSCGWLGLYILPGPRFLKSAFTALTVNFPDKSNSFTASSHTLLYKATAAATITTITTSPLPTRAKMLPAAIGEAIVVVDRSGKVINTVCVFSLFSHYSDHDMWRYKDANLPVCYRVKQS
jgi:hypothetical protein